MKQCNFPGCDRPSHAYGYCTGHFQQRVRGQSLAPLRPKKRKQGTPAKCIVEGCDKEVKSQGLCQTHYEYRRKGTAIADLKPIRENVTNKGAKCQFPGCSNKAKIKGFCRKHYDALRSKEKDDAIALLEAQVKELKAKVSKLEDDLLDKTQEVIRLQNKQVNK